MFKVNYETERAKNALLNIDCDTCYFFVRNNGNCIGDPYLYTCDSRIDLNMVKGNVILKDYYDRRNDIEDF